MVGANISNDPKHCPLCGQDNHCGVDDSDCWCRMETFSEELLSNVSEEKQGGSSCICQNCIKKRSSLTYNAVE